MEHFFCSRESRKPNRVGIIKNKYQMKKHEILIVLLICMGLTFIFSSCEDKVSENLLILIENRTDSSIHISLFPKKITSSGGFYPMTENGNGAHGLCESNLSPYNETVLFYSKDLAIKPYLLATKVFDSIYFRSAITEEIITKFTLENVTGYSENIFKENSTWDYKIEEWDKHTGRNSKVKDYCYRFVISEDNFVTP